MAKNSGKITQSAAWDFAAAIDRRCRAALTETRAAWDGIWASAIFIILHQVNDYHNQLYFCFSEHPDLPFAAARTFEIKVRESL